DDPDCEPCGADGTCVAGCPLPDPDCATAGVGEICQADTQCLSSRCVTWRGDGRTKFCTTTCSGSGDCPAGMRCQGLGALGSVCYYDGAPPGALGDACSEPTECGSYICEQGTCVYSCDIGAGMLCPSGYECSSLDGERFYCLALEVDGGGCSSSG